MRAVVLDLPFRGRWAVQNSPARRVPSHGTDRFGTRYAIDFVGVDRHHRTAPLRDWRSFLATEPPERFFSFGRPILAPTDGTVVAVHDGEPDHEARRSPLALIPYALGQGSRLRQGVNAITGNHVAISHRDSGTFVTLVHLRSGSLRVRVGDEVTAGQRLAECGNSGNSTQPHVHVQVTDSLDWPVARGVPLRFRSYRELRSTSARFQDIGTGIPEEAAVVEPLVGD